MSADNKLLKSALSLLMVAADAFGSDGFYAELPDVAEVVKLAGERITAWLDTVSGEAEEAPAFDALDACTVISALLEAKLDPRNRKTISPIRGVLGLAINRLQELLQGPSDDPANADEFEEVAA